MNREQIQEKLYKIIAEIFGVKIEDINLESNFQNDFKADSLDAVELIMQIEDEFKVDKINDEEADNFLTVKNILDYIERGLKGK